MRGPGSGRRPGWMDGTHCKETTEDYFALDIRAVKRHGLIEDGQEELPGIAHIEWISSGFGAPEDWSGNGYGYALRPWFQCPREGCQRRVAFLYSPHTAPQQWGCRTCRNLCYPVELESRVDRGVRRMNKIRFKLGPGRTRPKRMHHTTFVRLVRQYIKASQKVSEASRKRLWHTWEQMEKEKVRWELYRR